MLDGGESQEVLQLFRTNLEEFQIGIQHPFAKKNPILAIVENFL